MMTSMVFSGNWDMLGKGDHRSAIQAIVDSNVRMGVLFQYPSLRKWKIHGRFFPAAISARSIFLKFVILLVGTRMDVRKGDNKPSSDVFAFLTKSKDPQTNQGLSPKELAAECTTLIVAGSDTTSTAIAETLFYLVKFPSYVKKARAEVQLQFSHASQIGLGPELSRCKFLSACINEAMRLSPLTGAPMRREAKAEEGVIVDSVYVPQG
jgi:cytochrome P450